MQTYRFFGETIHAELALAALAVIGFCLLFVNLRTVLFLTMIVLLLPSLDTPLAGPARLLRWAFLFSLMGKGILTNLAHGLRPRPVTRVHKLVFLLAGYLLVSAAWSIGRTVTLAQGGAMIALWISIFLIIWNTWRTPEDVRWVCQGLFLIASLLFATEAIYTLLGVKGPLSTERYSGIFLNPNGLGSAVAFLGPFVYWKHRTATRPNVRLWTLFLGLIMAASVVLSGSRSGLLAAVVCMGAMVGFVHRVRLGVVLFGLAVPLLLLVLLAPRLDTRAIENSRVVRGETIADLGDRLPLWEKGFGLFLDRPWLGYGFAMNRFADIGWVDFRLFKDVYSLRGANYHNAHLQIALDLGIPGFLLFWSILGSLLWHGLRLVRLRRRTEVDVSGLAFFSAFLALFGDTFVHAWVFSPGSSMSIIFWLVSAAVLRAHLFAVEAERAEAEEEEEEEEEPSETIAFA